MVVITVFLISWVESLVILPAHLAHSQSQARRRFTGGAAPLRERLGGAGSGAIVTGLRSVSGVVSASLPVDGGGQHRGVLIGLAGYVFSGRIGMILMPRVESDRAVVTATLPVGSPLTRAQAVVQRPVGAGQQRWRRTHGGDRLVEGIFTEIDENQVEVTAYLQPTRGAAAHHPRGDPALARDVRRRSPGCSRCGSSPTAAVRVPVRR